MPTSRVWNSYSDLNKRCLPSRACAHTEKDVPMAVLILLLSPSPTMVPCFSCRPGLLPNWLSCGTLFPSPWCSTPYPPQAVSTQPILVLSLELTSEELESQHLASAWVSQAVVSEGSDTRGLCGSLFFALLSLVAVFFFEALRSLLPSWSPHH